MRGRRWTLFLVSTGMAAILAIGTPAIAQDAEVAMEQMTALAAALRERDAMIADLERRVAMLERLVGEGSRQATLAPPSLTTGAPAAAPPGSAPPASAAPPPGADRPALEVDPLAAERALERTLVETGNLLVPFGSFEIQPSVSYEYGEAENVFIARSTTGEALTNTLRVQRDTITTAVDVRFGLPYDAQIEARVPYNFVSVQEDAGPLSFGEFPRSDSAAGFGNISVGLAKTLLRESGLRPDVVARVSYGSATGPDERAGVALNDDFQEIGGSLRLLKRQDPLAFSLGFGYQYAFDDDDRQPGATYDASIGTFLAISPETSLGLGFGYSRSADARVRGDEIDGTGTTQAVASFSVSSILYRNVLATFALGIGLTEDSPDFTVGVSIPIRFSFR